MNPCSTCANFESGPNECHLHPPTVVGPSTAPAFLWPKVKPMDGCGDHVATFNAPAPPRDET